ncbi:MAG: A/G-specific adenine glycosylase [Chloroflexi bacterium]|nr:A/G-specific adenine glycosylase [Chloroflexota bacterium]
MTARDYSTIHADLLSWYDAHARDLPWRRTHDPYAILVSEVMLQQTQVSRVLPKYHDFLQRFPDLQSLAEATTGDVIRAWSPLGYNQRAVRLQRIAQEAVALGGLPHDPQGLAKLPGIGPYTSASVACFAFDAQVAVVDTNVSRVIRRLLGVEAKASAKQMQAQASELLPQGQAYRWNQAIMELGATVCVARTPACDACPIRRHCSFVDRSVDALPRAAEAKAGYRAESFVGSRRYFRGRIVELLRELTAGHGLTLQAVGVVVREGFSDVDLPWLREIVEGLQSDGLVRIEAARDGETPVGHMIIALP